jgi:hypothetical protein
LRPSATEVLRRGLDNVLVNWPVLLLRLAQTVLMATLIFGFIIAAIIPLGVSIGINAENWQTFDPSTLSGWLYAHWGLILWLLILLTVVITLMMAVYSFFQAAAATIYVDGQRAAEAAPDGGRNSYRAFRFERWFAGGVQHWWRVFLIYNAAWLFGALALLIPTLLVAIMMLLLGGGGAIAVGCIGIPVLILSLLAVGLALNAWTLKSTVIAIRRGEGAAEALREARAAIRNDFGRTFAVMAILTLVLIGTAGAVSLTTSFPLKSPGVLFMLMPFQLVASLLQSVVSTAVDSWFLATFAAMETPSS